MTERCEICGATEKIQRHHISYEPEIIQFLCVNCHKAVHNHGVGKAPGWSTLFEALKTDAEILFKEGATNKKVAKACDISYATASHWRKKLGRGLPKHIGKPCKLKLIAVSEDAYKKVMTKKREMEEREGKVVPIGEAIDAFLAEMKKRGLMKLEGEEE